MAGNGQRLAPICFNPGQTAPGNRWLGSLVGPTDSRAVDVKRKLSCPSQNSDDDPLVSRSVDIHYTTAHPATKTLLKLHGNPRISALFETLIVASTFMESEGPFPPSMGLQPLLGLGLPHKTPPFNSIRSSSCTGRTALRGSRGIALPFLDHGTRSGWGASVTPQGLSGQVRKISLPPGFDPRSQSLYRLGYPAYNTLHTEYDF
jgi:hypothetical protein